MSHINKVIVSTIGTSIITNHIVKQEDRSSFYKQTNLKDKQGLTPENHSILNDAQKNVRSNIPLWQEKDIIRASAESNALYALNLKYGDIFNKDTIHILMTTETWCGFVAAELIKDWLEYQGVQRVEIKQISNLTTANISDYYIGASNLVNYAFKEIFPAYQDTHYYHMIFNLTGGFKVLNGLMQILGMVIQKEIVYIFEHGSELITIPPLPLKVDYEEWFNQYGKIARKIELGIASTSDVQHIDPLYFYQFDNEYILSEWGALLWNICQDAKYKTEILEPPCSEITIQPNCLLKIEKVCKLDKTRIELVNKQLDKLAKFLYLGENPITLSYRFFNELGKDHYLIDAWSDKSAYRFVLKRGTNKNIEIIDFLDKGDFK
jgi:putative CRISPR-associated protein (TIGR02619 family)